MKIPSRRPRVEIPLKGGPLDGTSIIVPDDVTKVSRVIQEPISYTGVVYELEDGVFVWKGSEPL